MNDLEHKQYISDSHDGNDHAASESDSASSSDDEQATTAQKSKRKIEKTATHRADKNLLKIAFDDNEWMLGVSVSLIFLSVSVSLVFWSFCLIVYLMH